MILYVVYNWWDKFGGFGMANIILTLRTRMIRQSTIDWITNHILEEHPNFNKVIILNWKELDE